MNLFISHYKNIVIQDFLLKYQIKNTKLIPKLTNITLSAKFGPSNKSSLLTLLRQMGIVILLLMLMNLLF